MELTLTATRDGVTEFVRGTALRPVISEYDWRDINRVGPKLRGRQVSGKAVFHIPQK